jgi:hypothetical protein
MEKKLKIYKTLIYYDGSQLFLAYDISKECFLCMAIESENDDEYVAIPIFIDVWNMLVEGTMDLRDAYIQSKFWYHVSVNNKKELIGMPFQLVGLDERYLPDAGMNFSELGIVFGDIILPEQNKS